MWITGGKLIAFSGIDGAGKTTQINLLMNFLQTQGYSPRHLWTRGGYTGPFHALKTLLRRILKGKLPPAGRNERRDRAFKKSWVRNLWLLLAITDLMLIYGLYIRYLKFTGRIVIADRYLWDTWIDFRLNFPAVHIDRWRSWKLLTWLTPKPDISLLLMIPVAESMRRAQQKNEPFPDSTEVIEQRREYYLKLASGHTWQVVDCMPPISQVRCNIRTCLDGGVF